MVSLLQKAFVTDNRRLNVFWRILFYIIGFFLLDVAGEIVAELVVALLRLPGAAVQIASVLFTIPAIFGFTYFFRVRVDRRPWRGIALTPLTRAPLHMLLGILLGSSMVGLILIIEYAFGWLQIVGTDLDSSGLVSSLGLVLLSLIFATATGFIEELAFRGYIFQNLGRNLPLWLAILITGVLFGLLHFTQPGFGVDFVAQAVIITTLWVLCRLSTGILWLAIGWHAAWNWMEDVLGFSGAYGGHNFLHLKVLLHSAWIIQPELGPIGPIVELLGIAALWLWMKRGERQAHLQARLDDEDRLIMALSPKKKNNGA